MPRKISEMQLSEIAHNLCLGLYKVEGQDPLVT